MWGLVTYAYYATQSAMATKAVGLTAKSGAYHQS